MGKKNESTFKISEYSISLLNHLVQIHDTENIPTDNLDYHTIDEIFLNKKLFINLDTFDAFSIAMGSILCREMKEDYILIHYLKNFIQFIMMGCTE